MSLSPELTHTLEIDSVNLSFERMEILSGVYLKMETGKVSALLGRNGCGKSCLMRIIAGDLEPAFKSLRIDDVWKKQLSSREVLYCPQFCS